MTKARLSDTWSADRIRVELEKLQALQPALTRDQALSFFTKFYPAVAEGEVAACIKQMGLPATSGPRPAKAGAARSRKSKASGKSGAPTSLGKRSTGDPPSSERTTTCPECGARVAVSRKGKAKAHRRDGSGGHACVGSRRHGAGAFPAATGRPRDGAKPRPSGWRADDFRDQTGVPPGELARSDSEWIRAKGWLIQVSRALPSDVVTARRVLLAAGKGRVQPRPCTSAGLVPGHEATSGTLRPEEGAARLSRAIENCPVADMRPAR